MTAARNGTPAALADLTMELRDYLRALRRFWWMPAALALVGLVAGWALAPAVPYESTFRAAVIMPGDTEDPGSSERPELMILDDLLSLVRSQVFAERTFDAIPVGERGTLTIAEVQRSLDQARYGRVATVFVRGPEPGEVAAIVSAAAAVFADAVNAYLVAPGSPPATVQVLDPPSDPERASARRTLTIAAATFALFVAGLWIVWLVGSMQRREGPGARAAQPGIEPVQVVKNSAR